MTYLKKMSDYWSSQNFHFQGDTDGSSGGAGANSPQHGLVQLWTAMQTTVCGKPAISKDKMHQFSQSQDLSKFWWFFCEKKKNTPGCMSSLIQYKDVILPV